MTITITDNYPLATTREHIEADLKRQATEVDGIPGLVEIEVLEETMQRLIDPVPKVASRYLHATMRIEPRDTP